MDTRDGRIYTAEEIEAIRGVVGIIDSPTDAEEMSACQEALENGPITKADLDYIEPMAHHPTPKQRAKRKVGRNDSCPCGSRIKFKKCCLFKAA